MKYKLKLDYTADELKELKRLSKDYKSPINAIYQIIIVASCDDPRLVMLMEEVEK